MLVVGSGITRVLLLHDRWRRRHQGPRQRRRQLCDPAGYCATFIGRPRHADVELHSPQRLLPLSTRRLSVLRSAQRRQPGPMNLSATTGCAYVRDPYTQQIFEQKDGEYTEIDTLDTRTPLNEWVPFDDHFEYCQSVAKEESILHGDRRHDHGRLGRPPLPGQLGSDDGRPAAGAHHSRRHPPRRLCAPLLAPLPPRRVHVWPHAG